MVPIRSRLQIVVLVALAMGGAFFSPSTLMTACGAEPESSSTTNGFAGSQSCRECHEHFYQLWSTSFHGLAMQPYTKALANEKLTPQREDVVVGEFRYRAEIGGGYVLETGADGTRQQYPIVHMLGGKNVSYFLTLLERGRLQTLPVAYDVRKKEWFDTALSGVRHFPGRQGNDGPVDWRESPYTFNTSCYGCHVSQLSTNYDFKSDTYQTTWAEPGINCETCHGPSAEHNAIARATPKGRPLPDIKIISTKAMTTEQRNYLCASCHAKTTAPLTSSYLPGERFFDHFDLVTLESADYYPDGRDLGENYTYSSWLMSPCVKSGKLDCMHCHTSSGRYRFKKEEDSNKACLPCHEERVSNAPTHTRHEEKSSGNRCVSCHMPMTSFARMNRSDHSMLPPVPAATLVHQSPNACNLCHTAKDANWADQQVRTWHSRDYQAPVLRRTALIESARKRDWSKLPETLAAIDDPKSNEVFITSLIRLLAHCDNFEKVPVLLRAADNPSALVRSAAVEGLAQSPSLEVIQKIAAATGDDYRLVRVRAAAALAQFPNMLPQGMAKEQLSTATDEYLASLMARPDRWDSHYDLGNFYLAQNRPKEALAEYDEALKREPRSVMVMVNAAMADARLGDTRKAGERLNQALKIAPESAAALFNLGLVEAERGNPAAAERNLKEAFKADSQLAGAAYNLCIITSKDRPAEALEWCTTAVSLRPQEHKYAWTLAYYQQQAGDTASAIAGITRLIGQAPDYADAWLLLGDIHERQGRKGEAKAVYERALNTPGIPPQAKAYIQSRLDALRGGD